MDFGTFGQQPLPAPLTPTRKSSAPGFRAHARAKSVLVFPGALRAL
jgi:hypothetical protein